MAILCNKLRLHNMQLFHRLFSKSEPWSKDLEFKKKKRC
ncbi:Uncharacterized protein TCM_031022 isoform 1 [Theobroma cacao]|uniref:Uncharacterized protein isoform 1 n=2 Tax=Theobroma cacao TaxID=3641 RepID=A0A061F651_THECC|nr:Uncharacterized protein TCM_031022 isoform 1 [Theobroma cacao]